MMAFLRYKLKRILKKLDGNSSQKVGNMKIKAIIILSLSVLIIVVFAYFFLTYEKPMNPTGTNSLSTGGLRWWIIKGAALLFFAAVFAEIRGKK